MYKKQQKTNLQEVHNKFLKKEEMCVNKYSKLIFIYYYVKVF